MNINSAVFSWHGIKFNSAIRLLKKSEDIISAYVYGSVVSEHFRPDSDIDIALLLKPGARMNSIQKLQLAAELSSLLKRETHIGIISNEHLIFTKEVIENGQRLFTKNEYFDSLCNATAISMYIQLRENNKEVIDAYATR